MEEIWRQVKRKSISTCSFCEEDIGSGRKLWRSRTTGRVECQPCREESYRVASYLKTQRAWRATPPTATRTRSMLGEETSGAPAKWLPMKPGGKGKAQPSSEDSERLRRRLLEEWETPGTDRSAARQEPSCGAPPSP